MTHPDDAAPAREPRDRPRPPNPSERWPDDAAPDCGLREPYALQVLGDEMEPEFPDGCIVIIDPTDARKDNSYVFAEVEGVRWFRQYRRGNGDGDADGERLAALNPRYPDIALTGLDWRVLGVIVQRNIRRQVKHYRDPDRP